MNLAMGQVVLGLYAFLLAVGGIMGYVKAASKPSLIAGISSAALVVVCIVIGHEKPVLGMGLGIVLTTLLLLFFGMRFASSRKFMPGGLLTVVTLVVLVFLVVGSFQVGS
jgi:uncharacterized membrane protein (UPF0136 family)